MKAIVTKYLGPTNVKASRVKAYAEGGHSIVLQWDDGLSQGRNHADAAEALARKMKWSGCYVMGGLPCGRQNVFVNTDEHFRVAFTVEKMERA